MEVTKIPRPTPDPADSEEGSNGAPIEKRIELRPGEPVSFNIPADTNLVINVVNEKPKGFLSSLFSGLGCLMSVLFWMAVIFWIVVWLTP